MLISALAFAAGISLPLVPTVPAGRDRPAAADPLQEAIAARTRGDLADAAFHYGSWLGRRGGTARTRAAVQLALGLVELDRGDPDSASALFSRVRATDTPVAPWGAWYEALADHKRGRHPSAARECASYRARWPDGPHADECLVLIGDANVAAGERGPAIAAYQAYLQRHPDSPREESLRLGIALAASNGDPKGSVQQLQALILNHSYHSTGDTAQRRLDELAATGVATALPDTADTWCRLAAERKRCGFEVEAWKRFRELEVRAADDDAVAAWIDSHADTFRWGTKQYDDLARLLAEQYAAKPSSDVAWRRYLALARGGRWAEATEQLQAIQKAHPGRAGREDVARAALLGGKYALARDTWSQLGKTGGAFGREAKWLGAFAAYRAGDYADAISRLDAVVAGGGDWETAARWYRAKALAALGRGEESAAERARIRQSEPWSWYAALARNIDEPPTTRDGRWPGEPPASLPPLTRVAVLPAATASPTSLSASPAVADWSRFAPEAAPREPGWPAGPRPPKAASGPGPVASPSASWEHRPDCYVHCFLYAPEEGDRVLDRLATERPTWKDAAAAADLARAGAFELAAPIVARLYDAIDPNVGGTADPSIQLSIAEWRAVFLFVRDHYHVARFSWGAQKLASTPEDRRAALRFAYPTAHIDALYRHGQAYDVDPLLALGLMRQESVYRQWALSPTGAIGLMQIMPRTGARVAALMGDAHYATDILEDPSTNVRYGVYYLSRLMDRFDGVWPLAVASYNGGPHNVSAWLRPWGGSIPLDDFVEQIPYTETRDYVKKVTGYYLAYVDLYGQAGEAVRVPGNAPVDDPTVIDF